jgi:hypothetical protein
MTTSAFSPSETVSLVFIAGFAIQQVLQILDPFVVSSIQWFKSSRPAKGLPGGMADSDFKKAVMASLSFLLGLLTVALTNIRLLQLLRPDYGAVGDFLVTALVVGTGTEAVNTVLKFLGYVKDAQKAPSEVEVIIVPNTVSVRQGTNFQFRSVVKNSSNTQVEWKVLHGAGGNIDLNGLYTAPPTPGTYQIIAVSQTDSTKYMIATVTVTQ